MNERTRTVLATLLALVLALAALGVAGCDTSSDDEAATDETTTEEESDDAGQASGLDAEQAEQAVDIAGAYFVAQTDFTTDQFDWEVEAAAVDDTGQWWARVSATPKDDMTLETEQVYVYSPAGSDFWFAHDMGTGIDPATDESFPEEIRDELAY